MKEFQEFQVSPETKITSLRMDNGKYCDVYLPEKPRERQFFENEYCCFKPSGWVRLGGIWYPLGFKVVTDELKSLGLRNNTNIMTYPIGKWVCLPDDELIPDITVDEGGIWTALRPGKIKTLKGHCMETWEMETRGFLSAIHYPIANNDYRIKSQGVFLLKEVSSEADLWQE